VNPGRPVAGGRMAGVIAVVLATVVALAGCSGAGDDGLPPRATPGPTVAPEPTVDPADAAALAAVEGFLQAYIDVLTEGKHPQELAPYTLPGGVERRVEDVQANRREGRIFIGTISAEGWRIAERDRPVGPTDPASGPGVLIEACLDGSDWRLVDRDTGALLGADPDEHGTRHTGRFLAYPAEDGTWWARFTLPQPQWLFGFAEEHLDPC
jgi:hypothetical protein